jgi:hypothetical protein
MTPARLRRLLRATAPLGAPWPDPDSPEALAAALDRACDAAPADRVLSALRWEVHAGQTSADGLAPVMAGVRREQVVRWDADTVTFDGTHVSTGRPMRVRTLRAEWHRDSVRARLLLREGRVLQSAHPGLVVDSGPPPTLALDLPGAPLAAPPEPDDASRAGVLVRLLSRAVADLARQEDAGVVLPDLAPAEIVDDGTGFAIACLTLGDGDARDAVASIADETRRWWGAGSTPFDALLGGFAAHPPPTAREAARLVASALADDLRGRWVHLAVRAQVVAHAERVARLGELIAALDRAVPPPSGRGAVAVDLEGRTTVLESRLARMSWGPEGGRMQPVLSERGLDPREARRILRVRAEAPATQRLQSAVGGDGAFVDAACRWIATALELRTVRLLLAMPRRGASQ